MTGLYRSRLEGVNVDYVASFSSSLTADKRIVEADIDGTEAHNIMLYEQGIIEIEDLVKILSALETLRSNLREGITRLEGEYEDVHEFIEDHVIQLVGIEAGGKLHTGRSRNDQVALDIRIQLRNDLNLVSKLTIELVNMLLEKAEAYIHTPLLLYTHMQQAQVGTLGHYLLAYAEAFLRDLQRLDNCYKRVNLSPLGAGPAGGTSIAINRERTAQLLGFDGLVRNSLDATCSRDFMVESAACLAMLMVNMSRLAEDLILWSSSEFGFIELADEFASVSSIMPQKKNPTVLELIRGKTGRVIGNLAGLLCMVKALPSGYSSDLQETKPLLWDSCDQTIDSIKTLTGVLSSMKVNTEQIVAKASSSYVFATDIAEQLVAHRILTFREAHKVVGYVVREMLSAKKEPRDFSVKMVEEAAEKVLNRRIRVKPDIAIDTWTPIGSIRMRMSRGSPNPAESDRMLKELKEEIATCNAAVTAREEKLRKASSILKESVLRYLKAGSICS
ncbi:MAG: argininosuccinate lyase [Candidatus Bathyarchaeia archaeon]